MLYRETPEDLEAKYFANTPLIAREQLKRFNTLWDEAEASQELRRL
jgi:hypothetical protein